MDTHVPYATATPVSLPHASLPDADWADSFAITTSDPGISPENAARNIILSQPGWIAPLMQLRNIVVRPFGLKPGVNENGHEADKAGAGAGANDNSRTDQIGIFPVITRADTSITLGMNDRHLDFRLVVEIEQFAGDQTVIRAITLIKRHNLLGRAYLGTIMPFHRAIVPAMLNAAYACP